VFDLFAALDATDEQLDFPVLYSSARQGWVAESWSATRDTLKGGPHEGMRPLLDTILRHVPAPSGSAADPFAMVVTMMEKDPYLGRILTGRVASGRARVGDALRALTREGAGATRADGRITRILKRRGGFGRVPLAEASVGDIVSIAGIGGAFVTDTLAAPEVLLPLPAVAVDPPTLSMVFSVNDSPLAGKDGSLLTGSKIGSRLLSEAESNVSINVRQDSGGGEAFEVQGRGELQLGVLVETMRREGFELSISPPEVLMRRGADGKMEEPMEELTVELDDAAVPHRIAHRVSGAAVVIPCRIARLLHIHAVVDHVDDRVQHRLPHRCKAWAGGKQQTLRCMQSARFGWARHDPHW
jgi:GTP-binding protein